MIYVFLMTEPEDNTMNTKKMVFYATKGPLGTLFEIFGSYLVNQPTDNL